MPTWTERAGSTSPHLHRLVKHRAVIHPVHIVIRPRVRMRVALASATLARISRRRP